MIKLTRLGGEEFLLNADLIRYVEARPDTFITLTIGDRVVVEESMDEVLRRAIDYQREKHMIPQATRVSGPGNRDSGLSTRAW
jgi:flagellar protein FlbD